MPSPEPGPMAVDLNVTKKGGIKDPVDRDTVERALYALTGWDKSQKLIDVAMDVIDSYAWGVEAQVLGTEPVKPAPGHTLPLACPCTRKHLDEHTCPVTVQKEVPLPVECTREHVDGHACSSDVQIHRVEVPVPCTAPHLELPERLADMDGTWTLTFSVPADLKNDVIKEPNIPSIPVQTRQEARQELGLPATPMPPDVPIPLSVPADDETQVCSTCDVVKPLATGFYRDKSRKNGYKARCKPCDNEVTKNAKRRKAKANREAQEISPQGAPIAENSPPGGSYIPPGGPYEEFQGKFSL